MNGVHDMGGMHGFGPIDLGPYGQAPSTPIGKRTSAPSRG